MTAMDAAYEFDAPQYYDFRRTSVGTSHASLWFDAREGTPDKGTLAEVHVAQTVNKPAAAATTAPASDAKPNIVTSWGGVSAATGQTAPRQADPVAPPRGKENGISAQQQQQQKPALVSHARLAPAKGAPSAPLPTARQTGAAAKQQQQQPAKAAPAPKKPAPAPAPAPAPKRLQDKSSSPRMTRSVTKQRLEEAALQHAGNKAKASRMSKTVKAALTSARSTKRASGPPAAAAATTHARSGGGSGGSGRTKAAGGIIKPAAGQLRGVRLAGAVVKPTSNGGRTRVAAAAAAQGAQGAGRGAARQRGTGNGGAAGAGGSAGQRVRRVLLPQPGVPARSTKPLTLPEEPNLRTSTRASQSVQPPAPAKSPFKPLLVKVNEFQSKTPRRFKTKPTARDPPRNMTMTHPKEPLLRTATRARPSTLKPRSVEEEEEMAAMPAFHAQPVRPEVFRPVPEVQPRTERKPLTETRPFHFVSDDRASRRGQADAAAARANVAGGNADQFKALPLQPAILEAPVRLPKKARMSLTVPSSPLLLTKTRAHPAKFEEEEAYQFKARPVPDFLNVPQEFHAACEPPPLTQPVPFSLRTDQRGQVHQKKLQALVAQEEEMAQASRHVRAHPAPAVGPSRGPHRPDPRPLTVPQPFALQSEVRHDEFVTGFTGQVAEEEARARAAAQFKARPVLRVVPQPPHPSEVPLTAPLPPNLATEQRAVERQDFDRAVEDKARVHEAEQAAAAAAAAQAEQEAVREYRRSLRFKAHPVPDFSNPFEAAPSNRALTQAKTPQLGRKRKGGQ